MRSIRASSGSQLLNGARVTAPGGRDAPAAAETDGPLAALAAQYGLRPSAQRPSIGTYLTELARRWSFIMGFATARNIAMYTEAKLGQLWQVLAPLLNAGVYFLIFGVLVNGEPLTWYWLLVIPALALQTMFNAGIGMFAARTGARVNDFAQLLPFLMRTWLYLSGVIYSVQLFVAEHSQNHAWVTTLVQLNPAAIYITLVRQSLLESQRQSAFGAQHFNAANCYAWAGSPTRPSGATHAQWEHAQFQVQH